ncbi:hypothetical protein [Novosphingobium sp. MD-1]|uniref:hypothetical protein n=1 Tax=Novosphingobium sp. MD-1 TaxID=1630648 RepID=UPI00061C7333|nr:hypothetical protein [Novosphingobium sp. MD-1]GAO52966.1 hypothetical protein NMD1_02623 [Novosphingobium sp. MD-1]
MSDDWYKTRPRVGGIDLQSEFLYGRRNSFDEPIYGNPEAAAYWATLSLKQKIVGSLCSIAVGAAGTGLLIALFAVLH